MSCQKNTNKVGLALKELQEVVPKVKTSFDWSVVTTTSGDDLTYMGKTLLY